MRLRIATWSIFRLLISGLWFVYATLTATPIVASSVIWSFCKLTQPVLFRGLPF